ncbi:MAG: UbiD family decarboxylase, partial [Thermodesulfobacteriota bacterium]|nr:UbiD family decarboxylase [Thermodesulfobacteriota bacterium]
MEDLREFLRLLEEKGDILRVKETLEPRFEIAAFLRVLLENGNSAAAFFESVKGYQVPVVGNVLGTKKRLAYAFGVEEEEVGDTYLERRERPIEPEILADGPVKEMQILRDPDILEQIPVLTHHKRDAGPYFTCSTVVARDPDTGMRGMGIHRMQVKDKNRIGIFLATPPLSHFLANAERLNKPLEIAIVNGADPLTFFSSVVWAPHGTDKFAVAGGLAGSPVQLIKCETVDLEVPARAEYILEGHIIPGERETEGPFGESTGYYLKYENPVCLIAGITRRKDPLYHALLPFSAEEGVLLDFSWEMDHLAVTKKVFPFVRKVHLTALGMVMVVQIKKGEEGDGRR